MPRTRRNMPVVERTMPTMPSGWPSSVGMTRADFAGAYLVLDLMELFIREGNDGVDAHLAQLPEGSVRLAASTFPSLVMTAIERVRWNDDVEPLQLLAEWRANIDKATNS
jgi:hypothetical protein